MHVRRYPDRKSPYNTSKRGLLLIALITRIITQYISIHTQIARTEIAVRRARQDAVEPDAVDRAVRGARRQDLREHPHLSRHVLLFVQLRDLGEVALR